MSTITNKITIKPEVYKADTALNLKIFKIVINNQFNKIYTTIYTIKLIQILMKKIINNQLI